MDDLQEGGYYILQNNGGGKWYNYATDNALVDAKGAYDYSCVVRLKKNNGNITIQQAKTNNYYQALTENAQLTLGSEEFEFIFTQNEDGTFFIENNNLYINCNHSNASGYPLGGAKTLNGAFSKWNIFQVTVKESNVITDISEANNSTAYTVTAPRSAWVVAENGTALTSIAQAGLAADKSDSKQQFAFLKSEATGNYYLYSVSAGKFFTNTGALTDNISNISPVFFADASTYREGSVRVYFDAEKNINIGGSNQITVDSWKTADDGCSYYIEVAQEDLDLQEVVNNLAQEELNLLKEDAQTFINAHTGNEGALEYAPATKEALKTLQETLTEIQSSSDITQSYAKLSVAFSAAKNNIMYIPSTDKYYTLKNIDNSGNYEGGTRGAMVYDPDQYGNVDVANNNAQYIWRKTGTLDATAINNLWGFVYKNGNYYMYNVGKKQFAALGKGTYQSGNQPTWIFSDKPAYITLDDGMGDEIEAPCVRVRATDAVSGQTYTMSVSPNYVGPVITYDGVGDDGVPMLFAESDVEIDPETTAYIEELLDETVMHRTALRELIATTNNFLVGDGLGEYSAEGYEQALANANKELENDGATIESLTQVREALEAAIATLTLNLPKAGTFLRIKSSSNWKTTATYLTSNNVDISTNGTPNYRSAYTQNTDEIDGKETILYYDGNSLLSYATGYRLLKNSDGQGFIVWADAPTENYTTVTFNAAANGTKSKYNVIYNGSRYLYTQEQNNKLYADAGSGANQEGYNFELEEVSELPVKFYDDAEGWASFAAPVATRVPEGVVAYTATLDMKKHEVVVKAISGDIIPANNAVMLEGTADATKNFVIVASEAEKLEGNELQPTTGAESVEPLTRYVFGVGKTGDVGFYLLGGNTMPGFKAYFNKPEGAGSNKFSIVFGDDDITAITGVEGAATDTNTYYDLQGRRIATPQKGQLYIVNGKKVLY